MSIDKNMKVYKNKAEKIPKLEFTKSHEKDNMCESRIILEMHTGTHLDAPYHMLNEGKTIDEINLDTLVTDCRVIDLSHIKEKITKIDLEDFHIKKNEFILFKTSNSSNLLFNPNFVYLDKSGAEYLLKCGVIGIGTDGLGIERSQKNHETHKILLGNDINIIEGLDLKDIEEGIYKLIALPLKIKGAEASPVRAILIKE
ncbi:cyclase family protein [Helicovermis profundi]